MNSRERLPNPLTRMKIFSPRKEERLSERKVQRKRNILSMWVSVLVTLPEAVAEEGAEAMIETMETDVIVMVTIAGWAEGVAVVEADLVIVVVVDVEVADHVVTVGVIVVTMRNWMLLIQVLFLHSDDKQTLLRHTQLSGFKSGKSNILWAGARLGL